MQQCSGFCSGIMELCSKYVLLHRENYIAQIL
jgi:hypothetical protein